MSSLHIPMNIPLRDPVIEIAAIQPMKFWIEYKERDMAQIGPDGKRGQPQMQTIAEEWCTWVKKGVTIPCSGSDAINRLKNVPSMWQVIEPYHKAWKSGSNEEVIVTGTPLAIWPGVTREVVELLKPFNIRSVEDLSTMSDAVMQKVPYPATFQIRERARKFLATKDIAIAVNELNEKSDENAKLKAEVEALKKQFADMALANEQKPRGRKPKFVDEAA